VRLEGALFFGSHTDVDHVATQANGAPVIVIDLSGVREADLTGATSLARVADELAAGDRTVWVIGARSALRPVLEAAGLGARLLPAEAAAPDPRSEGARERRTSARRPQLSRQLQPSLD
jgi:MFS superfamily sulfate permease-like transporter